MATSVSSRPAARRAQRGFSLLEVLLVAVLIAAVGTVTVFSLSGGMEGLRLRSVTREMSNELRHARARAIASGQTQRFELDVNAHTWSTGTGKRGQWPEALDVRFTGARELQPRAEVGAIVFFADGASSGGRIELYQGEARMQIEVNWLTGQVRAGKGTGP